MGTSIVHVELCSCSTVELPVWVLWEPDDNSLEVDATKLLGVVSWVKEGTGILIDEEWNPSRSD